MSFILYNEIEWKELNEKYDKETIKELLSNKIDELNLPLPMRELSLDDACQDFENLLNFDETTILVDQPFFTRYDYEYPLSEKVIKTVSIGNKSSDYFHQENRWKCDSINAPSPYRSWHIKKFRMTLFNALWTLKVKQVDDKTLRTCIGLRKYIASQFRPSAAKCLYNHFNAKNILDFSSGWGDRLSGFMTSNANSYYGIDPNDNLIDGYNNQIKQFNTDKTIELISDCAENVTYDKKFDFIFTSPPYFNIERYTQEDNQSFKKYRKFDDWLNKFLYVTIEKAWDVLESNGILAINISDVYSLHTIHPICDNMNRFIATLPNSCYKGCYGYEMRKRPNSGALKNKIGTFGEPIWIWRKYDNG